MSLEKGNIVKINFSILQNKITNKYVLKNIKDFDEEYNNKHTVTQIYKKNPYTKEIINRIELDKQFVFYEDELIKI
jgi:hypothetical protein